VAQHRGVIVAASKYIRGAARLPKPMAIIRATIALVPITFRPPAITSVIRGIWYAVGWKLPSGMYQDIPLPSTSPTAMR
jgi:hypothetical protein